MQKITTSAELKDAILLLEKRKKAELELLKEEFMTTKENLRPSNVIKTSFNHIFTGPNLMRTAMIAGVGLTTNFITKKFFRGLSGTIAGKLLAKIL